MQTNFSEEQDWRVAGLKLHVRNIDKPASPFI